MDDEYPDKTSKSECLVELMRILSDYICNEEDRKPDRQEIYEDSEFLLSTIFEQDIIEGYDG